MLKIVVVDDQRVILEAIVNKLSKLSYVDIVMSSIDSVNALDYTITTKPDVVILDIDMPKINGLKMAEIINQQSKNTEIIFVTSHDNFIKDAFKVYAYDFIEKPIDFKRLINTLKIINTKKNKSDEKIEVTVNNECLFILLSEIVMVEAEGKHACMYTPNNHYTVKEPLHYFEEKLKCVPFFKSSRSYLINLNCVKSIEKLSRTSYTVRFKQTDATAVLTKKLYENFKKKIV